MLATTLSDAEVIEISRREMQTIIDRTEWYGPGKGSPESVGLAHEMVRLWAAELTEVGRFEVDLPPAAVRGLPSTLAQSLRRHWVYRRKDGTIVTLQVSQRIKLRTVGYVEARGFVNPVVQRA